MIARLSDEKKKSLKNASMAADVAENTIKKAYKGHYPYAARLIPNWFAEEEDVKKLSSTAADFEIVGSTILPFLLLNNSWLIRG